MFVRSILLGAAALRASAMLVVPEIEALDTESEQSITVEDFLEIPTMAIEDTSLSKVEVPCENCPLREVNEEGVVSWTEGEPSSLILDFAIDTNRLNVNGHQIFPPVPPTPITAVQKLEDGEETEAVPVGYAVEVMPVPAAVDTPGVELIDVRFTVLDLETKPVPVDTVAVSLIKDAAGDLSIAKTEIEHTAPPADELSWKQCSGKPKCMQELLFSRIRGLVSSAKARMMGKGKPKGHKGCKHKAHKGHKGPMGPMGGHHGPGKHHDEFDMDDFFPVPEFDGPKGFGPKGHPHPFDFDNGDMPPPPPPPPHHHGHHHPPPPPGAFSHAFSRVFRFIVIPAILGVLAGLTASAVGMLVGQAVVFFWRRHRGTNPNVHKAAWEDGNACEKQGLMRESTESTEDALLEYTEETSQPRDSTDRN